ncbi:hypothetical protein [Kaistella sp.]|uniref:hypothetical protein n=1 Tax=Kaistella sp. TaxID=2782235 RepID=UPI003C5119FE
MKNLIILFLLSFTLLAQAEQKRNPFFQSSDSQSAEDYDGPAAPPSVDDTGDGAPIDDYLPLLAVLGIGMVVYFGKKKYVLQYPNGK